MGDFAGAASLVAETESVAAATGSRIAPPYAVLRLRSLQGDEADAAEVIAGALQQAAARGQAWAASWAHWAAAALYNGLARYEEAASAAQKATLDPRNPWLSMGALPELIEAASRLSDSQLALGAFVRLERTTHPCGNDPALGIEARCRALVSHGETAERGYREAINRLGRTRLRPDLARAHLLYGEWLRRQHRRVDAREQLRLAHAMLSDIGMEAFAERARVELLATGQKVRKRGVETRDQLTAQERQIARLARGGRSNTEIAAQLFVSPRTVEWHLRNVFIKLGIRSRYELAGALPASDSELLATRAGSS
jgi:DNA-binding CsgD family transcriptional regulator